MMYGILSCLTTIVLKLQRQLAPVQTIKGYFIWQFPFSIHCGWIIAASAVNTNVVPVFYNATKETQLIVAYVTLGLLVVVGLSWLVNNNGFDCCCSNTRSNNKYRPTDFTPPLVLIWALSWVYKELQNPSQLILETFTGQDIQNVQYTVLGGVSILGVAVVLKFLVVMFIQRPNTKKAKKEQQQQQQQQEKSDVEQQQLQKQKPTSSGEEEETTRKSNEERIISSSSSDIEEGVGGVPAVTGLKATIGSGDDHHHQDDEEEMSA